jgi:hypothetical protein
MILTKAKQRYSAQRCRAKQRNISFNLTFDEWYNWWLSNGVDKDISNGPYSSTTLCMCRFNDTGSYELTNIYCETASKNSARPGKSNPMFGKKGRNQYS